LVHSPPDLVAGLEYFVSLLRNNSYTQAVDVELFFADGGKLKRKMNRVKTTDVDIQLATNMLEQLNEVAPKYATVGKDESNNNYDLQPFEHYIKWAINYCEAAKIDLKVQTTKAEITEIENKIESLSVLAGRFGTMADDTQRLNFVDFFERASNNVASRVAFLKGVTETDRTQAEDYQKKFRTFERKYFE